MLLVANTRKTNPDYLKAKGTFIGQGQSRLNCLIRGQVLVPDVSLHFTLYQLILSCLFSLSGPGYHLELGHMTPEKGMGDFSPPSGISVELLVNWPTPVNPGGYGNDGC